MSKEIYKWSVFYAIGRWHVRWAFRFFYRSICVRGLENIPHDKPVILAPNHQNALMDALAAMHPLRGVQVFMARADIFQNKRIARILLFLKIMPVFRIRDGYENLGKNDEVFNKAIEVLDHSRFLCIMPEGTHSERRQLRPLVKGIFRLAFKYIEEHPDKPAPVLIPVGLDYTSYYAYRSQLVINYGKPIDSLEFYESYKKNPAEGINLFRERLGVDLKKVMIHIDDTENYEVIDFLRTLFRPKKYNYFNRFQADKEFADKCNQLDRSVFETIKEPALQLKSVLEKYQIQGEHFINYKPAVAKLLLTWIWLIFFLPLFIAGYIFHISIIRLPKLITCKIDDVQFHSSVKFVLAAFLFPIWYVLWGVFIFLITHSLVISVLSVSGMALIGEFSYRYFLLFERTQSFFKIHLHKKEFEEAYSNMAFIKEKLKL